MRIQLPADSNQPAYAKLPLLANPPAPQFDAMQKRSWGEMYDGGGNPSPSYPVDFGQQPSSQRLSNNKTSDENPSMQNGANGETEHQGSDDQLVPTLSRKIKACAGCRKHKVSRLLLEQWHFFLALWLIKGIRSNV